MPVQEPKSSQIYLLGRYWQVLPKSQPSWQWRLQPLQPHQRAALAVIVPLSASRTISFQVSIGICFKHIAATEAKRDVHKGMLKFSSNSDALQQHNSPRSFGGRQQMLGSSAGAYQDGHNLPGLAAPLNWRAAAVVVDQHCWDESHHHLLLLMDSDCSFLLSCQVL